MPIMPDTKDWTWVLRRACPECGFDAQQFPRERVGTMIRDNAGEWQRVLARPDVRDRPDDVTWSPLEYACHVRDVFRLYDERLRLMLAEDDPLYPNWDQDETAVDRATQRRCVVHRGELRALLRARLGASPVGCQRLRRQLDDNGPCASVTVNGGVAVAVAPSK